MQLKATPPQHKDVYCANCKKKSCIVGIRFKCGHCVDYDLCQICHTYNIHNKNHWFIIIPEPVGYIPKELLIKYVPQVTQSKNNTDQQQQQQQQGFGNFGGPSFTKQGQQTQSQFAPLNSGFHSNADSSPPSLFGSQSATSKPPAKGSLFGDLVKSSQAHQPDPPFFANNNSSGPKSTLFEAPKSAFGTPFAASSQTTFTATQTTFGFSDNNGSGNNNNNNSFTPQTQSLFGFTGNNTNNNNNGSNSFYPQSQSPFAFNNSNNISNQPVFISGAPQQDQQCFPATFSFGNSQQNYTDGTMDG